MKFFVPELGTKIQLTKPWSFELFSEHRNKKLVEAIAQEEYKIV